MAEVFWLRLEAVNVAALREGIAVWRRGRSFVGHFRDGAP